MKESRMSLHDITQIHSLCTDMMLWHFILLKEENNTTFWLIRLEDFDTEDDIKEVLLGFVTIKSICAILLLLCNNTFKRHKYSQAALGH